MVETVFSANMVDDLIETTNPASKGAYSAVGTYSHHEIVAMVVELSSRTGTSVDDLLQTFGQVLFSRFPVLYPRLVPATGSAFDFLESIEGVIHVEVLKLYPDAQLPRLTAVRHSDSHLSIQYQSPRGMHHLGIGLIKGCAEHFGEPLQIELSDVTPTGAVIDVRKI